MLTDEEFESLKGLNRPECIKMANKLAAELNFKQNIPRDESVYFRKTIITHIKKGFIFGEEKKCFVYKNYANLCLSTDNKLTLITHIMDITDYGRSSYAEFAEDEDYTVVYIPFVSEKRYKCNMFGNCKLNSCRHMHDHIIDNQCETMVCQRNRDAECIEVKN